MAVEKVGKGKWENVGKTGERHGVMHSKEAAEAQKAAIFANDPKLAKERSDDPKETHHARYKRKLHEAVRSAVEDAINKHMSEHGPSAEGDDQALEHPEDDMAGSEDGDEKRAVKKAKKSLDSHEVE